MPTECQALCLDIIDRTENKTNDSINHQIVFNRITFAQITCFHLLSALPSLFSTPCLPVKILTVL